MDMSIAALSVDVSLARSQQDFGVGVLKMALEADESIMDETLDMVESLDPALGNNIDIMA